MRRAIPLSLALVAAAAGASQSYWATGHTWAPGTVRIQLELGASPALADGCADWSCSVMGAIERWNLAMGRVQMKGIANSQHARGELNGRNDVFFTADLYGKAFGPDTLALTTWWYRGETLIEADIGFNQAKRWDSYRGSARPGSVYDLRRVALHELGHVLGLGHPNDHGQDVAAMMNGKIGDLDGLTADDISGIQALYGAPEEGTEGAEGRSSGDDGAPSPSRPRREKDEFRRVGGRAPVR